MSAAVMVKRGMRVVWKPEWRDQGDENYTYVAVEDQHPIDGSFGVSTIENTLWIRPIQIGGRPHMVESAEPYLPVYTLTFLGLDRKGARVQLRRTLGDSELSVTEETLKLSTFRLLFRRYAKDCKIGQELGSGVEFPGDPARSFL